MQDQVMTLKQRGIRAEYLSSAQIDSTVQSNAESGNFDILYMTPEKACLISNSFWSKLLNIGICLLAVDEAHCISEWGHNFRVEYKQLDKLRDVLINVPFVGLTATATEKSFISDEIRIMVATIAFGMGIDKPDIRHVIHYGCPKSLDSYYQESGRCGRDGIASNCWLYYTRSDFAKADFYCREARSESQRKAIMVSFMAAQQYCMLRTCRRKYLLEYFGEICAYENCGHQPRRIRYDAVKSLLAPISLFIDAKLQPFAFAVSGDDRLINCSINLLRGKERRWPDCSWYHPHAPTMQPNKEGASNMTNRHTVTLLA